MVTKSCVVASSRSKSLAVTSMISFSVKRRACPYNSEHLGHNFVECFFVAFENILFEFVDLIENRFAVLNRSFFNLCFELGYLFLDVVRRVLNFFLSVLAS